MSRGRFEAWTPAIGAIAFVALWWTVYRLRLVDPVLLPSPEDSVRAIWSGFVGGALLHDFLVTVRRTLLAFAIAVAISVPLGIVLGSSPKSWASYLQWANSWRYLPTPAPTSNTRVSAGVRAACSATQPSRKYWL